MSSLFRESPVSSTIPKMTLDLSKNKNLAGKNPLLYPLSLSFTLSFHKSFTQLSRNKQTTVIKSYNDFEALKLNQTCLFSVLPLNCFKSAMNKTCNEKARIIK